MTEKTKHLPFIFILFLLTSCGPIFFRLMGLKKGKVLTHEQIIAQGMRYGISPTDSYELDTTYASYIIGLDSSLYKNEKNNHLQPLQALYFDSTGKLISYHVNCSVGGFPNLKWNKFGVFNQFPPVNRTQLDTILTFNKHFEYLIPLTKNANNIGNYDYLVIVHWNRFMGRQSKNLIRQVQENAHLTPERKIKIFYVNSDNFYSNAEFE